MPWKRIKHGKFDVVLAVISLVVTIVLSALTMARCRHRWQFVAIAAWKLGLSLTLGLLSFHVAFNAHTKKRPDSNITLTGRQQLEQDNPDDESKESITRFFYLVLYIPGLIAGIAGLFSLVSETIESNHDVKIVTGTFGGAIGLGGLVGLLLTDIGPLDFDDEDACVCAMITIVLGWVASSVPWLCLFGVLYSDWVLGAIAGNLAGSPSSDNAALYWTYFVAKRLPLLFS